MINQDSINVLQGSEEWIKARLGHVSASNLDAVMAKGRSGESETRKKYKIRLVAERLTNEPQESFKNSAMEWGIETEPMARMAYEVSRETFVDQTGFWKHPTIPWVGCSPDGLCGDMGLVEIKCPLSTTHLNYILADQVPPEYYLQVQGQLWVMNREWCDFISFDPRMPQNKKLFVKRCYRSNDTISDIEKAVKQFLNEVDDLIIKLGE